jgi:hypothetical protein
MLSPTTKRWIEHCLMAAEYARQEENREIIPGNPMFVRSLRNPLAELGALSGERALAG